MNFLNYYIAEVLLTSSIIVSVSSVTLGIMLLLWGFRRNIKRSKPSLYTRRISWRRKKKRSLLSSISVNKILAGGPFHVGAFARRQILYTGLTRYSYSDLRVIKRWLRETSFRLGHHLSSLIYSSSLWSDFGRRVALLVQRKKRKTWPQFTIFTCHCTLLSSFLGHYAFLVHHVLQHQRRERQWYIMSLFL